MVLKNIAAFGCSCTFGDELSDADVLYAIPSKNAWINYIDSNAKIFNYGISGASSSQIMSKLLSVNLSDIDLIIVMWTGISRLTFYKDNYPLTFILDEVIMYDQDIKISHLIQKKFKNKRYIEQLQEVYNTLIVEKKFLYNEYFKNILLAQEFLKSLNKKYYFTAINNIFIDYEAKKQSMNSITSDTHLLYDKIDKSKFFFPENLGYNQWADFYNYARYPNRHLKEDAHRDFGNLFSSFINNNDKNNIK